MCLRVPRAAHDGELEWEQVTKKQGYLRFPNHSQPIDS
jgi:hypothetical protein